MFCSSPILPSEGIGWLCGCGWQDFCLKAEKKTQQTPQDETRQQQVCLNLISWMIQQKNNWNFFTQCGFLSKRNHLLIVFQKLESWEIETIRIFGRSIIFINYFDGFAEQQFFDSQQHPPSILMCCMYDCNQNIFLCIIFILWQFLLPRSRLFQTFNLDHCNNHSIEKKIWE